MKKTRLFCMLMSVLVMLSMFFAFSNTAYAASETKYLTQAQVQAKLDELVSKYPDGSVWKGTYDGGNQCYGFARMIVNKVFGKTGSDTRKWNYACTTLRGMTKIGSVETCTEDSVKNLLKQARPGDVLQFAARSPEKGMHSMIVYSVSSTKVTLYECNYASSYKVTKSSITFKDLAKRQYYDKKIGGTKKRGTLSLVRSNNAFYTIKLNANGGTVSGKSLMVQCGEYLTNAPAPTRTGYTFQGWYTAASGGTKVSSSTAISKNQTLYAHWSANSYTITFNTNGGKTSASTKTVRYEETYSTLPVPIREGYTFLGWYTEKTGGNKVTKDTIVKITSAQTLYARWVLTTPTVNVANLPIPGKAMWVAWQKNGAATGFVLQYSESKSFPSNNTVELNISKTTVSKQITGLTKGKTYYVRVKTVCNNVSSNWSTVQSVNIQY